MVELARSGWWWLGGFGVLFLGVWFGGPGGVWFLVGLGGAGVVVGVVVWLVWWQLGLVAPATTDDKSPRVSHAEGVSNPCTVSAAAWAARTREMIVVARAVPSSLWVDLTSLSSFAASITLTR